MNKKNNNGIGRLVLVTNREPFQPVERDGKQEIEKTPGGLISALEPVMREYSGVWISGEAQTLTKELTKKIKKLPYKWLPVRYPQKLHEGFYLGFSNRVLWPLYHSMLGNIVRFNREEWVDYKSVNQYFALACAKIARPKDLIWVQDYQLGLVPQLLREKGLPQNARIGYFLHIPFPSFDLFRALPWAEEILRGMLGASLIAFHVDEYCDHFFDCVENILNLRCDRMRGEIILEGRKIHVRAIPIGIDVKEIYNLVEKDGIKKQAQLLHKQTGCEHLVVGVDRLDYTKGIFKRLKALEMFFKIHPDRRGKVSMVQLAVPSRTSIVRYQQLREEIEQLVGHINGLYATPNWTPVTYMCRSLPFDQLVTLYLAGDVAMVTPLRDGMNLVAKEYVAAHHRRPGALILSQLAGAAHQLTEAILVNPYDEDGMAFALEKALNLSEEDKTLMMNSLNRKVAHYDIHGWVSTFLNECHYVD